MVSIISIHTFKERNIKPLLQ